MKNKIRRMTEGDRDAVLDMMRVFYASPAVLSNGSDEIFNSDIDNCLSNSPYVEGFIFESDDGIQGYGMIAKSFSTEFGKPCIWIEDIYVKEKYRGLCIVSAFLNYIENSFPDCILRLEVEDDNERAMYVYKKCGFDILPYTEMKK